MATRSRQSYDETSPSLDVRKQDAFIRAKKRVDEIKGFYQHLAWYLIINIFLVLFIGYFNDSGYWSFEAFATPFFWGIGLFFHFLGVFGKNLMFNRGWEDRKIKEFMDKEKHHWE